MLNGMRLKRNALRRSMGVITRYCAEKRRDFLPKSGVAMTTKDRPKFWAQALVKSLEPSGTPPVDSDSAILHENNTRMLDS